MSVKQVNSFKGYPNVRHSSAKIYLKCPTCLKYSKNPQRVKTHKNLSSLDSHLSIDHKGELWVEEARNLLRQFAMRLQNE